MGKIKKFGGSKKPKIHLVFDEEKRREFLTGFHKRKLQRKKEAKEKFEKELKEERKRLKQEAKESYKKLVVSHKPIPELEHLLTEEYEDEDVTVKVVELSTNSIAERNNWIGANRPKQTEESEDDVSEDNNEDEVEAVPGMELKRKKKESTKVKEEKVKFNSEKDVKKALKKQATKTIQKSKVFQKKNKMERQKQKKKSFQQKSQKLKFREKQMKKRRK